MNYFSTVNTQCKFVNIFVQITAQILQQVDKKLTSPITVNHDFKLLIQNSEMINPSF